MRRTIASTIRERPNGWRHGAVVRPGSRPGPGSFCPAAAARCTTSLATSRTRPASSSLTARQRGRWSPARSRAAIPGSGGNASAELFETGKTAGKLAETLPFPVDRSVLERGQERYRIFCTPCHGELGDGQGMIVLRGFNPPPSYHSDELRKEPVGHFFDVMTRGYGTMYSYAARIPARDRWCIAAYIRALQLSQHAVAADLPPRIGASSRGKGHEHGGDDDGRSRPASPARPSPDPRPGRGLRRAGPLSGGLGPLAGSLFRLRTWSAISSGSGSPWAASASRCCITWPAARGDW